MRERWGVWDVAGRSGLEVGGEQGGERVERGVGGVAGGRQGDLSPLRTSRLSTARIDRALTGSAPPFEIVMSALTEFAALSPG